MKKIITLSLSLLIVAGLNAADNSDTTPTPMTKEEALERLQFAKWDAKRLSDIKLPLIAFARFKQATDALTPKTRRKQLQHPDLQSIVSTYNKVKEIEARYQKTQKNK